MQSITFAHNKQKIAEFVAESMEFARDPAGLLVTASGEMVFQDTPLVEALIADDSTCHVTIMKDGAAVVEQHFQVSFFALEPDNLAVLLQ